MQLIPCMPSKLKICRPAVNKNASTKDWQICSVCSLLLQAASNAKDELQAAIRNCHGSHTARWLTDTAAACLDVGLEASPSGLQLRPVSIQQVSARVTTHFKHLDSLVAKLRTSAGVKYFTLLGASQMPSLVLLNIDSVITPGGRTTSLSTLMQSVQTVTSVKAPLLPAGVDADVKEQRVVGSLPLSPAQPARKALDVSLCSLESHAH